MASRATSIRCRSVSPSPRSATPFPMVIGADHLKKTNELLTQEVALLRARVVSLELELEKAKEEAQEESAKCKAANELIKSLRQQLETTKLPNGGGGVQVGRNTPSENVNNRDQGRVRFSLRRKGKDDSSGKLDKGGTPPEKAIARPQEAATGLMFFEGNPFDLEDLLRADAEVLGKGTFGTSYKAVLENGITVVVKRLRDVIVGKQQFEQQTTVVGSIKHENVTELRAYYYSRDEKMLIYDYYYSQGSVASMLHGEKGGGKIPLDWETRQRIAIGAARGIAQIHRANGGKLVHGNIKTSNVFLNSQQYGCVSDVGLFAITSSMPLPRARGYRAPEITNTGMALQPSDVYSFGVLLLELLSGKSTATNDGDVFDLVWWVQSVVHEEWTSEVLDVELLRYTISEEKEAQMLEMLEIAMACVVREPDQRPKMPDVVKMIEKCLGN